MVDPITTWLSSFSSGLAVRAIAAIWGRPAKPATTPELQPPPGQPPAKQPPPNQEVRLQVIPHETQEWLGSKFIVYAWPLPDTHHWSEVSGLFVLALRDPTLDQAWTPLLVGLAGAFDKDLPTLPEYGEAQRRGATHLHVRRTSPGPALKELHDRLVEEFQPPLNIEAP